MKRFLLLPVLISSCFMLQSQVTEADSLVLVSLYNNTNGSNWTNKFNWLSGNPVSTWHGIKVSEGRVESILLYGNNLVGSLPQDIGTLSGLAYIDLSSNKLSGEIPESIGQCITLRDFDISSNDFSGTIPATMTGCKQLRKLNISSNKFTGSFPEVILSFDHLDILNMPGNNFEGTLPEGLSKLTNLELLDLSNNNFSGPMVSLRDMGNLSQCFISSNQLTGDIADFMAHMTNLYYLILSDNQFTGNLSDTFFNPGRIQFLDAAENKFSELGDFTKDGNDFNLRRLNVYGNAFPFEYLEVNSGVSNFTYSPQANRLDSLTVTLNVGDQYVLHAGSGGEHTLFQWYHNGEPIVGATQHDLFIDSFDPSDAGEYYATMSNTLLPNLILTRNPVILLDPTTATNEYDDVHLSICPNPAQDFIYLNGLEDEMIFIYDTNGKLMYGDIVSGDVAIRDWPAGTFLVFNKERSKVLGRFVKL